MGSLPETSTISGGSIDRVIQVDRSGNPIGGGQDANGNIIASTRPGVGGYGDELDTFVYKYYPTAQWLYKDDFSNGSLNGWREQFDSNALGRTGITLTDEARLGAYSVLLHTRPANNDECWMRKGFQVPPGVKKVIKGCYFMFHGVNVNTPRHFQFDFDYQQGDGSNHMQSGSPTGNARRYWSVRWLNYDTALRQKLQVNTGTAVAQSFVDVPSGYVPIGWNESEKPLLNHIVCVFDIQNKRYESILMNGNYFNLVGNNLQPGDGANLLNYDGGAIDINLIVNRSDAPTEAQMTVERPFLAYVY
jgi:hypothetical protein